MDLHEKLRKHFFDQNWRAILNLKNEYDETSLRKILWVWPSERNFNFIKNTLDYYHVKGIVSVGCGCGLLEWILQESTGMHVEGVEINKEWWQSKYSITPFISLKYTEDKIELKPDFALLFCYFNDGKAFRNYVGSFKGKLIIIIGPGDGAGRHTDPQPFNVDFEDEEWNIVEYQEVDKTGDFIAVYLKGTV